MTEKTGYPSLGRLCAKEESLEVEFPKAEFSNAEFSKSEFLEGTTVLTPDV